MEAANKKYKVLTWKNFIMLHWMINPGLAINELILGQTVPKEFLVEKESTESFMEKTFVRCPHCGTIHSLLEWSQQNKTGFGNWFGLYCNHCGKIIPCLRNFTSLIILAITFPIWYWFKDMLKEKWLIRQKEKFSKPLNLQPPVFDGWYRGLQFAAGYYLMFMIIDFIVLQETFTYRNAIGNLVLALILGLIFESSMKSSRTKSKPAENNT